MDDYDQPADLRDVTLGKLIDKHEKATLSKGLSSLLNLSKEEPAVKVTKTETIEFDPMVMNEILRTVREKNSLIDNRFDNLEYQISKLKRFDNKDKKFLVSIVIACLLIGLIMGSFVINPKEQIAPIVVNKVPKPIVKKKMITKKFVNLRATNSPKAKKILTIAPSQEVEVLEQKGGWIKIKYHNKLTGKKFTGHVWEEYLAKIKN